MTTAQSTANRARALDPLQLQLVGRILGGAFWTALVLLVCLSTGLLC